MPPVKAHPPGSQLPPPNPGSSVGTVASRAINSDTLPDTSRSASQESRFQRARGFIARLSQGSHREGELTTAMALSVLQAADRMPTGNPKQAQRQVASLLKPLSKAVRGSIVEDLTTMLPAELPPEIYAAAFSWLQSTPQEQRAAVVKSVGSIASSLKLVDKGPQGVAQFQAFLRAVQGLPQERQEPLLKTCLEMIDAWHLKGSYSPERLCAFLSVIGHLGEAEAAKVVQEARQLFSDSVDQFYDRRELFECIKLYASLSAADRKSCADRLNAAGFACISPPNDHRRASMQLPFLRQPPHIQKAIAAQSRHIFPEDIKARAHFSVGLIDVPSSAYADLADLALEAKEHGLFLWSDDYKVFLKPWAQVLQDPLYRHYVLKTRKRLEEHLSLSEIVSVLDGWPRRVNEYIPVFMDSLKSKHSGEDYEKKWDRDRHYHRPMSPRIQMYKEKYLYILCVGRDEYYYENKADEYRSAHRVHLARREGLSELLRDKKIARRIEQIPEWNLIPYEECKAELISGQECVFTLEKFADLREPVLWNRGDAIAVAEYASLKKWLADNPIDPTTRQPLDYSQLFRAR